jgi:hypothetical protein
MNLPNHLPDEHASPSISIDEIVSLVTAFYEAVPMFLPPRSTRSPAKESAIGKKRVEPDEFRVRLARVMKEVLEDPGLSNMPPASFFTLLEKAAHAEAIATIAKQPAITGLAADLAAQIVTLFAGGLGQRVLGTAGVSKLTGQAVADSSSSQVSLTTCGSLSCADGASSLSAQCSESGGYLASLPSAAAACQRASEGSVPQAIPYWTSPNSHGLSSRGLVAAQSRYMIPQVYTLLPSSAVHRRESDGGRAPWPSASALPRPSRHSEGALPQAARTRYPRNSGGAFSQQFRRAVFRAASSLSPAARSVACSVAVAVTVLPS